MATTTDAYIDNLHKQIYVSAENLDATVAMGSSEVATFGLSDIADLPGQSTWFIRSIRFHVSGFTDLGGVSPYTRLEVCGGIIDTSLAASTTSEMSDFQSIAGFPLKDVQKYMMVQNSAQHNNFSYQKTYRPRKALTLNREQNIIMCMKNNFGNDAAIHFGILLHAERGD